jgi:hypothetical protein
LTYGLTTTRTGVEATVTAKDRAGLFRDALGATLEAAYAGTPSMGDYEGQVVPIQAVGFDDLEILANLVQDCLRAVGEAPGTLHAPRWLSFDDNRVTATLPATSPKAAARHLAASVVAGEAPLSARMHFTFAEAH